MYNSLEPLYKGNKTIIKRSYWQENNDMSIDKRKCSSALIEKIITVFLLATTFATFFLVTNPLGESHSVDVKVKSHDTFVITDKKGGTLKFSYHRT